jgi:hypothetical protein
MGDRIRVLSSDDPDGLRLAGLGRIPRCETCPRYEALVSAHRRSRAGRRPSLPLPEAPENCSFQACAALVPHFGWPAPTVRGTTLRSGKPALAS